MRRADPAIPGIASRPELLPSRPRLLPNEALSSYVYRLAHKNGLRPCTFLNAVLGTHRNWLGSDFDNRCPPGVAKCLSSLTGIPEARFRQATLEDYAGTVFQSHSAAGRNLWIIPTRAINNQRLRPGLQFCPHV